MRANLLPATALASTFFHNPFIRLVGALACLSPLALSAQSVTFAGAQSTIPARGLNFPEGVAVNSTGDVFIADPNNNRVVEPPGGGVQTEIGSGLSQPAGVAVDSRGDVFIADSGNNRIVEVLAGSAGQIAVAARGLIDPEGMAVDGSGNLFIADRGNDRVVECPPVAEGRRFWRSMVCTILTECRLTFRGIYSLQIPTTTAWWKCPRPVANKQTSEVDC